MLLHPSVRLHQCDSLAEIHLGVEDHGASSSKSGRKLEGIADGVTNEGSKRVSSKRGLDGRGTGWVGQGADKPARETEKHGA